MTVSPFRYRGCHRFAASCVRVVRLSGETAAKQTKHRMGQGFRPEHYSVVQKAIDEGVWLDEDRGLQASGFVEAHGLWWKVAVKRTRDGAALTFASSRAGLQHVFRLHPRSGEVTGPLFGGDLRAPGSWSPDGRRLAFHEVHAERARDIWIWPRGGEPEPWLATAANERAPAFSPDGRWLAYVSDAEAGDGDQVYVRAADDADAAPIRVSPAGGTEPVWSSSDGILFYRRGRGLYRIAVGGAAGDPTAGAPEHVFDGAFLSDPLGNLPAYDVAADGSHLVMLRPAGRSGTIHVLGGWQAAVFPPPGSE